MCSSRSLLILSSMAARVVDLPEPVGPVTSTNPRGLSQRPFTTAGSPSESNPLGSPGIGQHAIGQRLGIRGGKRRHVEGPQFAVDPNSRRTIRGNVKIATAHLNHLFEKFA